MAHCPEVSAFYDSPTGSIQYIVSDPATSDCALIDPVLDFDEKAGRISTENADRLLGHIEDRGLKLKWILDTHPHADHLSAADYLKAKTGVPTGIGEKIVEVQLLWKDFYNLPAFPADGSQWDRLFAHGETFTLGSIPVRVMHSPGHTLASVTYVVGNCAFIHDTLFMPDSGTARADFPGGSSYALWNSIEMILDLPPETRLFTGHDYRPRNREAQWQSTVEEQRKFNIHLSQYRNQAEFVAARDARDRTLPIPRLMLYALQVNMNAGRLPAPESNGQQYLKIPLGLL
jgi:glyoxylase-like metal-dependent hydrolase (beta-lactamase superfamily II)